MFIQTQETPNPNTVKFLPGQQVMKRGVAEFKSLEEASCSHLAQKIIGLNGVATVFFGSDFISVTKQSDAEWTGLNTRIMAAIMDHYMTGFPLFREGMDPQESDEGASDDALDSEIVKQIKVLIEERVRPQVAMDGGDIVFESFEDGIVYLQMRGACAGCPSSTLTLKSGIENMLKHYVPEVQEVRQSNAL